jgi:O-antigen/teichoic acid export membrane protein
MNLPQQLTVFIKKPSLKSAGIYSFSNFFAKSIGFFLLFIYSNPTYMNVEENGLLSLLASAIAIFVPFLSLGIVHSTSVEFFKLDKNDFKDFFTSSLVLPVAGLFIGIAILFLLKDELKSWYHLPESFVFIIPLIAFFTFCYEVFVILIRSNDEPVVYLKVSMLRLAIDASPSLFLVVSFALRWKGRVIGMLAASFAVFVMAFIYFRRKNYLFGKIKKKYVKAELIYAMPIMIFQAGSFCLFSSDKFFLSSFANNNEVGIYSYACTFSTILSLGCTAVLSYIFPQVYKLLSEKVVNYKQIRTYFFYYFSFALIILIAIVSFTPFLYQHFINEKYSPGLNYLFFIATGYFFWNINYFFYAFLLYKKHKRKLIVLSLISIFISLVSNYFFIKYFGAQGAGMSVFASFLLVFVVTLLSNKREAKLILIDGLIKKTENSK